MIAFIIACLIIIDVTCNGGAITYGSLSMLFWVILFMLVC